MFINLKFCLDNTREHPAPIIKAVDHNQEVFEGKDTNLRCIIPRSNEVSNELINFIVFYGNIHVFVFKLTFQKNVFEK